MEKINWNFFNRENEIVMYNNIVNMLLAKGYKPLNSTTTIKFDCKITKTSNYPFTEENKLRPYPYSINITTKHIEVEQSEYKIAA